MSTYRATIKNSKGEILSRWTNSDREALLSEIHTDMSGLTSHHSFPHCFSIRTFKTGLTQLLLTTNPFEGADKAAYVGTVVRVA